MRFPSSNPTHLAYNLREAKKACGAFEDLEELYSVLSCYSFKTESDSVLAIYTEVPLGIPTRPVASPSPGDSPKHSKRSAPEALSLIDVLAELVGNKSVEEIYFPNVILPTGDKKKLYDWTVENDPYWCYIDHGDKGITVTRLEVDIELSWKPEDDDT